MEKSFRKEFLLLLLAFAQKFTERTNERRKGGGVFTQMSIGALKDGEGKLMSDTQTSNFPIFHEHSTRVFLLQVYASKLVSH